MKIAMVADLHGNLPAVEALDRDLARRGIKHIYCLGDMIGKGPSSADTMDWALSKCEIILQGNWDGGIGFKEFPADEFYYNQLGEKRMKILRELPKEHVMTLSGRKTRLIHGRPTMPRPIPIHDGRSELEPYFLPDFEVLGYADVHTQGVRIVNHRGTLFNTGSVGNAIGSTYVQYCIVEAGGTREDPLDITMVSLSYDNARAAEDARLAGEKGLVNWELFIREVMTGHYARK